MRYVAEQVFGLKEDKNVSKRKRRGKDRAKKHVESRTREAKSERQNETWRKIRIKIFIGAMKVDKVSQLI